MFAFMKVTKDNCTRSLYKFLSSKSHGILLAVNSMVRCRLLTKHAGMGLLKPLTG